MFLTIRQVAAKGILPQHRLRAMLREKRLPGVYSGTRFLVNVEMLEALLAEESRAAVREEDDEQ